MASVHRASAGSVMVLPSLAAREAGKQVLLAVDEAESSSDEQFAGERLGPETSGDELRERRHVPQDVVACERVGRGQDLQFMARIAHFLGFFDHFLSV